MGAEYVLYFYGIVCCGMIVFNVAYAILLRGNDSRMKRRILVLREATERQLERLERGETLDERYVRKLRRKLCRVRNLIAFDRVLRELDQNGGTPALHTYRTQLQPCFLYLAFVYRKRETTQAAYFSYFLSRYMEQAHMPIQTMQEVLLSFIGRNDLYCRVNGLQALYTFGSVDHILAALSLQDQGSVFLHEKILTEGLLSFTGDHQELIARLWERLDTFTPRTRLAILNYIRFQSGDYGAEMFVIMENPTRDKELRLSAIRYFGRYSHPEALEPLLAFVRDDDPEHWEYATVSASALAHYSGQQVIDALKGALHSSNWYVRAAASASLEALGVNYEDMIDIVTGNDRYAREIMTYRLEARRIQHGGR